MKKYLPMTIIIILIISTALVAAGFSSISRRKDPEDLNLASLEEPGDGPGSDEEIPRWEPSKKEEVVYGLLDFFGNPEEVYVVNSFTDRFILDYGRYSEISNMTSSEEIQVENDRITVSTGEEQFFYQGTLENRELPWNIDLAYLLNGRKISPKDLEGEDGKVEITIDVRKNDAVDPVFHEYYVMQVSITLDTEKFTEIESPDGVFASAGRNRIITHTILPDEDATITVSAEAKDFSMKEIQFSALPFSMVFDVPLDDDLLDGALTLADAIRSIHEGVRGLNQGIHEIHRGARALNEGNAEFGDGLEELSDNSTQIVSSSRQIGDALKMISDELNEGADMIPDMEDFAPLIDVLLLIREAFDGSEFPDNSGEFDLDGLRESYGIANEMIDEAITSLPDEEVDLDPLYEAVEGNEELTESLDQLREYYESSRDVRETYDRIQKGMAGVDEQIDDIIDSYGFLLEELPERIDEILELVESGAGLGQIGELIDGMNQLSNNYERFHSGLSDYMAGVRELSEGQREIQQGYEALADGLGELAAGSDELEKGTGELSDGVSALPSTIQDEIDRMLAQYDYSDFEPVSFVSEKNTNVSLVQFVFKTPEIGAPEEENGVIEEPEPMTFWQRLLSLFGLYDEES